MPDWFECTVDINSAIKYIFKKIYNISKATYILRLSYSEALPGFQFCFLFNAIHLA